MTIDANEEVVRKLERIHQRKVLKHFKENYREYSVDLMVFGSTVTRVTDNGLERVNPHEFYLEQNGADELDQNTPTTPRN